jgi:hypothetical protein
LNGLRGWASDVRVAFERQCWIEVWNGKERCQNCGVLHAHTGALAERWAHRMDGVASDRDAASDPVVGDDWPIALRT